HIQDNFQLPYQVEVTLYAQPEGSGAIRISTITPNTNPWQGIYFNGVPIQIEAIPAPGYNFSHWSGNNLITTPNNPLFSGILANPAPFFQANFVAYNTAIEPSATTSTAFSLAPNPATNVLWVQKNTSSTATNKPTVCQIIDLTGRIVLEQKIINTTTAIDISQLPASAYVCQMIQDGSVINTLQWVKIGQ
ncbi:MAG TPA: T9SS type A sorting domain-containing protein, partial [Chitinophagales bacterium]|nr:T9SS type A sorting domain-containing protein [Chitinophagales bacterium]